MQREATGGVSGGAPGGVCGTPDGLRCLPLKDENSSPCHVLDSLEVRCAMLRRGSREAAAVLVS